MTKHFMRIRDLGQSGVYEVLHRAFEMKHSHFRGHCLQDKVVTLLFEKASTQSRVSFEAAVQRLGGSTLFMAVEPGSRGRTESLHDTLRLLAPHAHCVVGHSVGLLALPDEAPADSPMPLINGYAPHGHPCQVMADLLTIAEHAGPKQAQEIRAAGNVEQAGLSEQASLVSQAGDDGSPNVADIDWNKIRVAWVGDGTNAANSWIEAAMYFPFELFMAIPEGYDPHNQRLSLALQAGAKIFLTREPAMAVDEAHYVHGDMWPMNVHGGAVPDGFCIDAQCMESAAPEAMVLHSLPALRGNEVADDVFNTRGELAWVAAENRIWVHMAILERLFS